MKRPVAAFFLAVLLQTGFAPAPQPAAKRADAARPEHVVAPAGVASDADPAAPPADGGLFGGEPIASVPDELTSLDLDKDGIVWIGSSYFGLIAFKDGKFTLFDQYNTPMMDCEIKDVVVDTNNIKWITTGRGQAYKFDNLKWEEVGPSEPRPYGESWGPNEIAAKLGADAPAWFAPWLRGLQLVGYGAWTSSELHPQFTGRRLAWQSKSIEELVNQEAIDVDMQQVILNPRPYLNKKLRFKGQIASGFEFMGMRDASGKSLGIWPEWELGVGSYPRKPKPKKPAGRKISGDTTHISDPAEYVGFLEWGGHFGHMGGSSRQFTIVEEYPADASTEEKANIKAEYLKKLPAWKAPLAIEERDETQQTRDARGALAGVWKVMHENNGMLDAWGGGRQRWIFANNEVVRETPSQGDRFGTGKEPMERSWGTFRVDNSREPARIDAYWNDSSAFFGVQLGIYRLKGDKLFIRWPDLSSNPPRPSDFSIETSKSARYIELERDTDAVLPLFDSGDSTKDDRVAINALSESNATMELDNHSRVIRVKFDRPWPADGKQPLKPRLAGLAGLPLLENVGISREITDADLGELEQCKGLVTLAIFEQPNITDAGLKHLVGLSKLQSLRLYEVNVSDAGIASLAGLKGLRTLDLWNTKVTGATLGRLCACPDLEAIDVGGLDVTSLDLGGLTALPRLRALSLDAKISDAQIGPLAGLTKLRHLRLANARITDAGIASLSPLIELRSLDLGGTGLTDTGAARLHDLKKLRSLDVGGNRLTGAGLREFAGCRELETLNLNGAQIAASDLAILTSFPNLASLWLVGDRIDNSGIAALERLPKLKYVFLSEPSVSADRANGLANARPGLTVELSTASGYQSFRAAQD